MPQYDYTHIRKKVNMPFQPETSNLSVSNYRFKLSATPNIEYRVQSATLPGINLGSVPIATPFTPIKLPGNITYDDFSISFLAGELLRDYLEIVNWMKKLGYPDELSQYANQTYDASLILLNSSLSPSIIIKLTDIFPTSISSLTLDQSVNDTQYAQFTASFSFTSMSIVPVD